MNPLLDSEFLVKLNNDKNRTVYARIISLNQYEHPIEQLEGVVTAGSITIDGQSAVRRVCSLTLSAKNLNINNVYWGITTKVKIEIGLQNNVDSRYENIIWFRQGVFILTDFKTTQVVNNYTINLTGKDKMCLLNGDVSGNLPAPVRFDSYTDANKQGYIIGASGKYNNFIDDAAAEAILAGFQERYGSDYQFIRGAKKILNISYKPKNSDITTGKIKFSPTDDWIDISSISTKSFNEINTFDINLDDKDVYGFIVTDCIEGDQFTWTIEQKIPIPIIIQEMLHQFGQEKYSNIVINDIDPYALEMLDSAFSDKYYLLHDGNIYINFISQNELLSNYVLSESFNDDGSNSIQTDDNNNISNIVFRNYIEEDDLSLIEILEKSSLEKDIITPTKIVKTGTQTPQYTVQPILPDEVAGYGMTLLVYPDELIGQPGDSITSILDKIVNMLGDYEYFYDLNGQFIFQAKPAYIKTAWNNKIYQTNENYIDAKELRNKVAYTFDDSLLTTQYQNTPNMNNIKNDYIIWGERKNLSGNSIKFHGRYAINNIPLEYTDFNGYTWTSNKEKSLMQTIVEKKQEAIAKYQHIYNYPAGYKPEEGGWWEINDWANYYQSIFGVDLSVNQSSMNKYHIEYDSAEKERALSIFQSNFLQGKKDIKISSSDVITLIYTDNSKTDILRSYSHGGDCTSHQYVQFMDIRLLGKGWTYGKVHSEVYKSYRIENTFDPSLNYLLSDGRKVIWGYHPDYTTSFIYKPVLPNDESTYINMETLVDVVYEDTYNENGVIRQYATLYDVDWRHLIHVMADDWYAHHTEDDYEINLRKNNSWPDLNIDLFPYGRTGYEQYYLDFTSIGGFWQDLYNIYDIKYQYYKLHPDLLKDNNKNLEEMNQLQILFEPDAYYSNNYEGSPSNTKVQLQNFDFTIQDEQDNNYKIIISVQSEEDKKIIDKELSVINNYVISKNWESYTTETPIYYRLICFIKRSFINDNILNENNISLIYDLITKNNGQYANPEYLDAILKIHNNFVSYYNGGQYKYWNRDVIENPENLLFWFDFFKADEMGIGKFATSVIGDRPKTINDSAIKTIIYRDTPDIIYCSWSEYEIYAKAMMLKDGYKYIIIGNDNKSYLADTIKDSFTEEELKTFPHNIKQNFVRSIRGKTVHDQADTMLYQYSYYNDTVNISSVPIYYLQPNTIISTKDELSKVTGYYIINKINISLAYNGIMSITAIKSPERIY